MGKRSRPWLFIGAVFNVILMGCQYTVPVAYIPPPLSPNTTLLGVGEGEACQTGVLFFPPFIGAAQASLERAVGVAVASRGGDALIQVTIDYSDTQYVLFHRECTHVRGTVVRTR